MPAIAKHLLLDLCTYMDQGTAILPYRWSPSLTLITRDTSWSRRSVVRYLQWLEDHGWLARIRPTRHNARTRHARTAYTVMIPDWLGPESPLSSAMVAPALVPRGAQAREPGTPDLGPVGHEAREPGAHSQNLPYQPDNPDRPAELVASFYAQFGRRLTPEAAAAIAARMLARPGAIGQDPQSYIRRVLATDRHPERWLDDEPEETA